MPNDAGRIAWIRWLIAEGYGDRLLVAQDICFRHRLSKYGGHGYHYILAGKFTSKLPLLVICGRYLDSSLVVAEIVPRMLTRGLSTRDVQKLLVDNPRTVLTFAKPQPAAGLPVPLALPGPKL